MQRGIFLLPKYKQLDENGVLWGMTEPKNVEIYMANPTISLDFPILVMHIAIFRLCIMHYALCMHFPHVLSLFPTKTNALRDLCIIS